MNSNDSDPTRGISGVTDTSSAESSTDSMPAIAKSKDSSAGTEPGESTTSGRTEHGPDHGRTEHGPDHGRTEHGRTEHGPEHGRTEHGGPDSADGPERPSFAAKAKGMLAGLTAGTVSASGSSAAGAGAGSAAGKPGTRRRVRLTLARLDPWSVMKLSFLIAIGIGIATVVATMVLWQLVDAIGLWDKINEIGETLSDGGESLKFLEYFRFSKFVSYATLIAIINVVIITALGTLFAFLYNIVAALLGGLKFTFTDD